MTINRDQVDRLISSWRNGADPDAAAAVRALLPSAIDRSLLIDLAYEEYCLRTERNEKLDAAAFASCFPDCEQSLLRVIEVHLFMNQAKERREPPFPKDNFAGYVLKEELARGPLSRVYLVEDEFGTSFALKISKSSGEYDIAERLPRHPHIIPYLRKVASETLFGIVMPYISGRTLRDEISTAEDSDKFSLQHEFSAQRVVLLGVQIADALQHIHRAGVVHSDLKPANIMLDDRGARALVMDFDLAQTATDQCKRMGGTLPYMAPKQIRRFIDERPRNKLPSPAEDIFALGVLLYEIATGKRPFDDDLIQATPDKMKKIAANHTHAPSDPRSSNPQLPTEIAQLILACLSRRPADRPSSSVLKRRLRRHLPT